MQQFNNYMIPIIPFLLVIVLIAWSLLKKEKWVVSALLAISFSSVALIFLIVRDQEFRFGNADVGFAIAMYASAFFTVPLAGFGWFLGRRLSIRSAIFVSFLSLVLNFLAAYAYQAFVKKNVEIQKIGITFDCEKLPYHCAIRDQRLGDIPALKKSGMDIEAHDSLSKTALWYGINNAEAVKVLLENGANPDSFNIKSETPLSYVLVVSLNPNLLIARLLIKHGAQINRTIGFRKKISILNLAIINKNIDVINFALENGADPFFVDGYKKNACERLKKMPRDKITNLRKFCPLLNE